MSNRYRVEVTIEGSYDPTPTYRVLDYCVKPGELPKRLSVGSDAMGAINFARKLNKEDDAAKAEWDADQQDVRNRLQDRVAQFSMDVETHAKRYYVGAKGLAVYGSHEAIDHLRGKLNCRYRQIMDLGHVNKNLRANLRDAQSTADDFKKRNEDMGNQLDAIRRQTLSGRFTSESIVDYIKRLQNSVATGGTNEALAAAQYETRMLRIQCDNLTRQLTRAEGDYSELKGAVIGLASNL